MSTNQSNSVIGKLAIFGTSGFAYEVADVAVSMDIEKIILLTNEKDFDNVDERFEVLHESEVSNLVEQGYQFAMGIGEPELREKVFNKFNDLEYPNLIHKNASLGYGQRELINKSQGNVITAGVAMTNNIQLGNFCIFNLLSTVGHDCIIEDFVSVMPSVNISGNVKLEKGAYLGVGATILQGQLDDKLTIGEGTVVGAASLVRKSVPSYKIVVGSPAKILKDISK
ncbi:hypothetical protein [Pseudoalteromonas luteoviolacea]|uniref:PglD N-terminal domain-containing protein n=1 Tax=Pseudoalteromonas luteoviolacea NCIMB 1942 TaxID=1365253 RepID=A0A162A599_9GAMM|nr:hypothetical protein [Pseudoalteromonas luteoviolacea]KZN44373.1 hypothetical protein N482_16530 [Pseudoalteromonas luteoviolacea NCIMB 1942]